MKERILIILPITIFVVMLGLGIVAPLMPVYARNLGATGFGLGLIFSSFAFARMIFMPIVGKHSDEKGRKRYITYGLFMYAVFSVIYIVANSVTELIIIRFLHGFVSAMVLPVAMAYMGEAAPEGKEGAVMGLSNMSLFVGMGFGPVLGGYLEDSFGMNSVFYAMGGLSFIAFLLAAFMLPDLQLRKGGMKGKTVSYFKILKNRKMRGLLLFRTINAVGRAGILSFLPIFAARVDLSSSQIGVILSVNIILAGLLQGPCGKLADIVKKQYLVVFGAFLGAVCLFIIPLVSSFWDLFFACMLMGIGGALSIPAATAIIVDIGQDVGMGASMGLFDTAMSVGMMTSPLISGIIVDHLGLNSVFYVSGLISLFGIFVFYSMIGTDKKQEVRAGI